MAVNEESLTYSHPLYEQLLSAPGLGVAVASVDRLLTWGMKNSLWVFPMATSCCGIEFRAAAASRVDLDRMGTIVRGTPRQADVMVVAGTITVKMAPRVLRLWEQMPEPRWCIAMGSCAISGDFYRNMYAVVPGIDTFLPVDVYIPGCPPNPEAVMQGLLRLQEKVEARRTGKKLTPDTRPELFGAQHPCIPSLADPARPATLTGEQMAAAIHTDVEAEVGAGRHLPILPSAPSDPIPHPAEDLVAWMKTHFGAVESPNAAPLVPIDQHLALAATLKGFGYRQLVGVAALHRFPKDGAETYDVIYALRSIGAGSRLASWRVSVPATDSVPSLAAVFAGADWQEREQFDMVGVRFSNHPDLRRILLPESWVGHPMRRDYSSSMGAHPWR
jgi:NADH-quinone oxidoreductase subunit B/C/D